MKKYTATLLFVLMLLSLNTWADFGVSFVRITCIPETHYFQVEYESISGDHLRIGFGNDKKSQETLNSLWNKNGYFNPSNLKYECKFPEQTYKVVTTQPDPGNGHCGVQPPVTLSLYENDKIILKNVYFGPSCSDEPTLNRVDISNPPKGWGYREVYLWLALRPHTTLDWKLLSDSSDELNKAIPIDQNKIVTFAKEIQPNN